MRPSSATFEHDAFKCLHVLHDDGFCVYPNWGDAELSQMKWAPRKPCGFVQVAVVAMLRALFAVTDETPIAHRPRWGVVTAISKVQRRREYAMDKRQRFVQDGGNARDFPIGKRFTPIEVDLEKLQTLAGIDAVQLTEPGQERKPRLVRAEVARPPVDRRIPRHFSGARRDDTHVVGEIRPCQFIQPAFVGGYLVPVLSPG